LRDVGLLPAGNVRVDHERRLPGVRFEFGKRLDTYQAAGGEVTAGFADGTKAEGDLLIWADDTHGVWIRDLVMPFALRRFANPQAHAWLYTYHVDWDKVA
jgi:hypothetical protein